MDTPHWFMEGWALVYGRMGDGANRWWVRVLWYYHYWCFLFNSVTVRSTCCKTQFFGNFLIPMTVINTHQREKSFLFSHFRISLVWWAQTLVSWEPAGELGNRLSVPPMSASSPSWEVPQSLSALILVFEIFSSSIWQAATRPRSAGCEGRRGEARNFRAAPLRPQALAL